MANETNNFLKLRDEMTDAQSSAVSAQITRTRVAGENYTLTQDAKDILIRERGNTWRVSPKGKMTFIEKADN